jgi:hypothetical protein
VPETREDLADGFSVQGLVGDADAKDFSNHLLNQSIGDKNSLF